MNGVIEKRLPYLNPQIFRTDVKNQIIPKLADLPRRDTWVFRKVEPQSLDLDSIPTYEKTQTQMEQLLPII